MRINIPDQRPSTQSARIRKTHGPVAGRAAARALPVRMVAPVTGSYGCGVSAVDNFAGGALPVAPITGEVSGVPPRGRPV